MAGRTTDPRKPWYAASDPKTILEVGLQKQVTCPNVTAQPQVTEAKVHSRTAKNELPQLGYFPTYGRGKATKKLAE